jgi:hypothetical protein
MIKGIHLALGVKTYFDNSTPVMGSRTKSSSQKPVVPTNICHRHHRKEEKENMYTESYKANIERLRSARLTHRDQAVKFLDMQRLQTIKTFYTYYN